MLTHSDFLVEISTDPLNSLLNCFLSCQRCGNCGVERELILFSGHPWCQRQWQCMWAPGLAAGCSWQGRLQGRKHCQALFLGVWIPIWKEFGDRVQLFLSSSWVALAQMPKGPVMVAASLPLCSQRCFGFPDGNGLAFQKYSASVSLNLCAL